MNSNARQKPPGPGARAAGVALWRHVADGVERSIADGSYPPGGRLPGESEIAELYSVNRHTVRRAMAALAERGVVRAERGSGTYVETNRISYPIRSRTRFSEIVGTAGREAGGRLIASALESADPEVARRLGLKTGAPIVRIELMRHADRVPICVATSWLPADRFADAAKIYAEKRSMTQTLRHFGVRDYRRSSTKMMAGLADAADAIKLELDSNPAVVIVESVDVDLDGKPIVTSRARFAAERIEFVIES
jgi:GntR family phosphonate transport system transcriptional regulator